MKQVNLLLAIIMAAATGLFAAYLFWVDNSLDTVGPVITIADELLELSVEDPEEALMQGVTAMDDRDGNVTASVLVESIYGISEDNVTTVTYAAFDRAGNVSKLQRKVRYTDYESPKFTLSRSLCFPGGSDFELLDHVGARDVLEGDIRRRVRATLISNTQSINVIGSHTVRFQVTNSLGDTVEADFPVEVYDPEWYTASVVLDEYLLYLDKGDSFDPKAHLKSFVVRGESLNISRQIPSDVTCGITSNVNTSVPGIYKVEYTLSQDINLATFSGRAILIVIVQE